MSLCRSAPSDAAARFIATSASCCGSYLVHMGPSLTVRSGQARGNFIRMIAEGVLPAVSTRQHCIQYRVALAVSSGAQQKIGATTVTPVRPSLTQGYL